MYLLLFLIPDVFLPILVNAKNPPMAVVRKFVHLLDQSDQDFQEELELMKLREEVVTLIRSNQQLENDLNLMDIKIGLLVKNKITLQVGNVLIGNQLQTELRPAIAGMESFWPCTSIAQAQHKMFLLQTCRFYSQYIFTPFC